MIKLIIKEVIKIPPPIKEPIANSKPSISLETTKLEITSLAPFPKANIVTPAIF